MYREPYRGRRLELALIWLAMVPTACAIVYLLLAPYHWWEWK